jgi:hypothetical protein
MVLYRILHAVARRTITQVPNCLPTATHPRGTVRRSLSLGESFGDLYGEKREVLLATLARETIPTIPAQST